MLAFLARYQQRRGLRWASEKQEKRRKKNMKT
jgi:hypothetical protein